MTYVIKENSVFKLERFKDLKLRYDQTISSQNINDSQTVTAENQSSTSGSFSSSASATTSSSSTATTTANAGSTTKTKLKRLKKASASSNSTLDLNSIKQKAGKYGYKHMSGKKIGKQRTIACYE